MGIFFAQKYRRYIILYLKYLILLLRIINILDCDSVHEPILKDGSCSEGQCTDEEFKSEYCKIDNEIIKTQWLNNIIYITEEEGFNYVDIMSTSNEDLILISNTDSTVEENKFKRKFYGLKKNGRNYFIDSDNSKETPFYQFTANSTRAQGDIFSIKLKENLNNKEYIISISLNSFEIYDLEKGLIYEKSIEEVFGIKSIIQYISSFIELENNVYALGIIGMDLTNQSFFFIYKLSFTSLNNPDIELFSFYESSNAKTVSCFQTESKRIMCFFQDDFNDYVLIAFDQNYNYLNKETITNGPNDDENYFECVHFIGEAGAFAYFLPSSSYLYINFKQLNEDDDHSITNYFSSINEVSIIYKLFLKTAEMNKIIKLNDLKICYVAIYNGYKEMCLVIINSFTENKIIVKYFLSHTYNLYLYEFTNEVRATLYNGLIAMASSFKKGTSSVQYSSLIIFSYPNSTDFDVDISENIQTFTNIEIDLNSKGNIDNNIFGYIFNGTKIIEYSNGLILKSTLRSEIIEGDILIEDENLILVLSKEANILKDSKIVYAMMATEPSYEVDDKFRELKNVDYTNGNNNEKQFFDSQKKSYIGRHSYCKIIINEAILSETDCDDNNCERCLTNTEKTCINCKHSYELAENGKGKICLDYHELESSTNLEIEKQTTIPSIIEPSTVVEATIPEIKDSPTTSIETTIPTIEGSPTTSIETTIPKIKDSPTTSIETTIPKIEDSPTTLIETTIPEIKFSPTSLIETTIPKIEDSPTTLIETTIPGIKYSSTSLIETTIPKIEESTIPEISKSISTEIEYNNIIETNKSSIQMTENISSCSKEDIKNNNCGEGKITLNQINEIKNDLLNQTYIKNKTNTIIKTENVVIQLSKSDELKNSDIPDVSNIDLGKCENLLKKEHNIPESESLIIFKADIKSKDLLATYVQYEVYNPINLEPLNLDICNNIQITINVPVKLDETMESIYDSLSESGYNLFNENDSFYQDICATYTTINGTDIILADRKKDIYTTSQSISMCQTGCQLKTYNSTTKKANCDCSIRQNEVKDLDIDNLFDKNEISDNFYKTLANSNFQVLKCYKLIILNDMIKKNIGEILMTIIFIILSIFLIISCVSHNHKIKSYINIILHNNKFKRNKEKAKEKDNKKGNNKDKKKEELNSKNKTKIKSKKSLDNKNFKIWRHISKKKTKDAPPKKNIYEKRKRKRDSFIKSDYEFLMKNNNHKNLDSIINIINKKNSINQIYKIRKSKEKEIKGNNNTKKKQSKSSTKLSRIKERNSLKKQRTHRAIIHNYGNYENIKVIKINSYNDSELNSLTYQLALKYDNRSYFQYYWSLLIKKQLILFAFLPSNDYNLNTIKISLFLLSFSLYFTINGFFFNDETMHKVYEDKGTFDLLYQIPQILYSTIISTFINIILKHLSLSERNIIGIKEEKDIIKATEKSKKVHSCLKLKFSLFFILSIVFMLFFWYYISCFCAVYINTQIILIKDTLISFGLSMLYPFGLNLVPGFFRIPALRAKNKNRELLYKISLILSLI